MSETDILFETREALGLITLNRPQAMNALTHDMALRLDAQLRAWAVDDAVRLVAIQGAGEKAFCAGGDIRALYEAGKEDGSANFQFYADEYRLNTLIKRFPKPYVSLMDGVVMGGGVGVAIHGSHRVGGDRTLFAMPETGIGLFPDVGGTYFLPRLPGEIGMFLGLTGARLKTADALYAGVIDAYVPSGLHGQLIATLAQSPDDVDGVIRRFSDPAPTAALAEKREEIDAIFGGQSLADVLAAAERGSDWARAHYETILTKSPFCTRIAFRQIREGAGLEFEDCMRLEYRLARACMTHPDFYEGVRAVIIDKDGAPNWSPATLDAVTDGMIDAAFAPLGEAELAL